MVTPVRVGEPECLMMAGSYTLLFFPVLYLGEVKGYSRLGTGLAILPWPLTMLVTGAVCQFVALLGVRAGDIQHAARLASTDVVYGVLNPGVTVVPYPGVSP
jgi:hypothetical protein